MIREVAAGGRQVSAPGPARTKNRPPEKIRLPHSPVLEVFTLKADLPSRGRLNASLIEGKTPGSIKDLLQ
jgi:hypothetical protein